MAKPTIAFAITFWLRKLKRICGAKMMNNTPAVINKVRKFGRGKNRSKNKTTNTKPNSKTRTISNCAAIAAQSTAAINHFGFWTTCKNHKQKNVNNKKGIAKVTFDSHLA